MDNLPAIPAGKTSLKVRKITLEQRPGTFLQCYFADFQTDFSGQDGFVSIIQTVKCLLIYPNPESALNEEAGKLLLEHYNEYSKQAKMMTEIYALQPKSSSSSSSSSTNNSSEASSSKTTLVNKKRAAEKLEKKKLEKKRALKRL